MHRAFFIFLAAIAGFLPAGCTPDLAFGGCDLVILLQELDRASTEYVFVTVTEGHRDTRRDFAIGEIPEGDSLHLGKTRKSIERVAVEAVAGWRCVGKGQVDSPFGNGQCRTVAVALDSAGCQGGTDEGTDGGADGGDGADAGANDGGIEDGVDGGDQGGVNLQWIPIPGGRYDMGSTLQAYEQPVHEVNVPAFEMTKGEITVDQYLACADAGDCETQGFAPGCNRMYPDRGNYPMNCTDWYQAEAFCQWANGRLPSEAEWEYAARSAGKDRTYPWGEDLATCDYTVMSNGGGDGCGQDRSWPLCSMPAGDTEQGLCDMSGNVAEWVADLPHPDYNGAPGDGSAWTDGSDAPWLRMQRGGSWIATDPSDLRAAARDTANVNDGYLSTGFRCAR